MRRIIIFVKLVTFLLILCQTNSTKTFAQDLEAKPEEVTSSTPIENAPLRPERLTIISPGELRPLSDYHVLVNLLNSEQPAQIDLRLTGARDSNREKSLEKSILVQSGETQTVKFEVPDWPQAEYTFSAKANAVDRSWNFSQEAEVTYIVNSYSALIQTDKALYKPGQEIQFRVLFVTKNLTPLPLKDEIKVQVLDPDRNIIKEWANVSNYRGLLSLNLPLSDDPMFGDYRIQVEARQQTTEKVFSVAEYILPTFDVDIELPKYTTYNDSKIVATVKASYTYGKPVNGHVTLTVQPLVRFYVVETRPLDQMQYRARLVNGSADINVDIVKDLQLQRDPLERGIEFFALVEEDHTSRKYNKTKEIKIHDREIKIELVNSQETFKPGLGHLLHLKVAHQDDTPVENNGPEIELRYSSEGQTFEVVKLQPFNGLVEHMIDIPKKVPAFNTTDTMIPTAYIELEVTYRKQIYHINTIYSHISKSGQFLQISLPQLLSSNKGGRQRPKRNSVLVGDDLKVRIRGTEPMQQVICQGLAKGDIVWALGRDAENKTEFEFNVKIDQRMAPLSTILCFYVRSEDKEIIADRVQVQVEGSIRNAVRLSVSRNEAKPGQEVEVGLQTKPNSLVGLLGIDQSVLLLKSGNDITNNDVLGALRSYDYSSDSEFAKDAKSLFEGAGVIVLTNNMFYDNVNNFVGKNYFGQLVAYSSPADSKFAQIRLSPILMERLVPRVAISRFREAPAEERIIIRSNFPETWMWENGTANTEGLIRFNKKLPDTITSWVLTAFSMNENYGLAVSNDNTRIRVFRPFFIKLNLPYSIIRGEIVNIQAVIFNYSKRPTSARVTMDNSNGEFEFVEAANNIEDEKMSSEQSETRVIKIAPEDGSPVSFLVRPKRAGTVDIKMTATSEFAADGIVQKLIVKPEGQTQHLNKAMLIKLNPSEHQQATMSRNISIDVPSNAVPDSQKVFVSVVGDILGPGLSNVDDLLRLPYGCGEQNMINLVPNIVIMNYLQNTRRLKEAQRLRATRNIETGYQRELKYKRLDGSFSAFGEQDENGSVWLTAYVLKTFQQAKSIIKVDEDVVRRAAYFIAANSNNDGGIKERGMLHHKALSSEGGHSNSAYLTAYSMIALLQKPIQPSEQNLHLALRPLDEVIQNGLHKLEHQLVGAISNENSYDLAIITYALHLANRAPAKDKAYEELWAKAIEDPERGTHWADRREKRASNREELGEELGDLKATEIENEFETINSKKTTTTTTSTIQPPLKPVAKNEKQSEHQFIPNSLNIEMTSFALLTTVLRGEIERALPIVKWLISQQNSNGGFASTQDTVLAIEALASFANANAALKAPLSIDVELIYPRISNKGSSFRKNEIDQLLISNTNALVNQRTRLPDNITWVQVRATGSGSAVALVSWQYNLLVSAEKPAFYLNPILDKTSNANYLQLSVCTYYKAGDHSNMAVMEVELPSGYIADLETLQGLMSNKDIKRVDTANGHTKVLIYLDRVTRDEICLTVPAHRTSKVSNNRPVPVSIYDYYNRQQVARIFYEPHPTTSCDICDPADSCGESCSTRPKKSEGLMSLHEQRKLKLAQLNLANATTTINNIPNSGLGNNNHSNITAYQMLPLAPVFVTLVNTVKNISQSLY